MNTIMTLKCVILKLKNYDIFIFLLETDCVNTLERLILLYFWLTVKAAPHECVIRTSQP